jgi:hypothetical protein
VRRCEGEFFSCVRVSRKRCYLRVPRLVIISVREGDNCDATINGNRGCPVLFPQPESYGPAFNGAGGGWYAIERSPSHIKVWFWTRNDPTVPQQVKFGGEAANPDEWVRLSFLPILGTQSFRSTDVSKPQQADSDFDLFLIRASQRHSSLPITVI